MGTCRGGGHVRSVDRCRSHNDGTDTASAASLRKHAIPPNVAADEHADDADVTPNANVYDASGHASNADGADADGAGSARTADADGMGTEPHRRWVPFDDGWDSTRSDDGYEFRWCDAIL